MVYAPGPGTAAARFVSILLKRSAVPNPYLGALFWKEELCLPVVTRCWYEPGPGVHVGCSLLLCSSEMNRFWAVSRDAVPNPNEGLETYVERTWTPHVERVPMVGVIVPREGCFGNPCFVIVPIDMANEASGERKRTERKRQRQHR